MKKTLTNNIWITVLAWLILLAFTQSCKSAKTIQTAITKKDSVVTNILKNPEVDSAAVIGDIIQRLKKSEIDFETFGAKIKVDYTDQTGKSQGATAFVRMRKDSLMWISLTGTLGVEGFRALIRPDTVWVMDKMEKTISKRSIGFLQEITSLPVDFEALQDIIMGNPVYFSDNIVSYKSDANNISALSIGEFFKHLLSLNMASNTITHSKIDDIEESRNRTCHIWLDGYAMSQNRNFSTRREITITEKSKLNIKLEFKQFAFDEAQGFPFSVPKNYKEK